MAKALFGHVGGPDMAMTTEIRALRARVAHLEATVMRLRGENDRLTAALDDGAPLTVETIVERAPALT